MLRWPSGIRFAVALLALVACDESREPPLPPNPDKAIECVPPGSDAGSAPDGGASLSCGSGEVCVQGRCYEACTVDEDCGPRESCSGSGVCVRDTDPPDPDGGGPPTDAGFDAGAPLDPCAEVTCDGLTVCHPRSLTCTACNEASLGRPRGSAGVCDTLPVCDIANGVCVTPASTPCAPCNLVTDCGTSSCTTRMVFEIREQVCLVACSSADPTCPAGMTCNEALSLCEPAAGVSCTTWLAGTTGAACTSDTNCNPLAASGAFYPDTCDGEVVPTAPDGSLEDAGPATPGRCLQPCGVATDCAESGRTCAADFFCR